MPLKVVHTFSRMIRFDDHETSLAAIREVWEKWVERLPYLYHPGPEVTVDEQLIPFKGCCPFRQYRPSRPAKYGWPLMQNPDMLVRCKSTPGNRLLKSPWPLVINQGKRVVLDVTDGLRGHNVTCDNFFTSYELSQVVSSCEIDLRLKIQ